MGLLEEARKRRKGIDITIDKSKKKPDVKEKAEPLEIPEPSKATVILTPKKEKKGLFGMFKKKEEKIELPEVPEPPKPLEVETPKAKPEEKIPEAKEPKKEKKFLGLFKKKEEKPVSIPGLEEMPSLEIPEPPSFEKEIPEPPSFEKEIPEPPSFEKEIPEPPSLEEPPALKPEEKPAPMEKVVVEERPKVKAPIPEPPKPVLEHPETVKLKEGHEGLQREIVHSREELKRIEHDLEAKRSMALENEKKLDEKERSVTKKIEELRKIKETIETHKEDIADRTQKMEKARTILEKQHGATEEMEKRKKEMDERESKLKERQEKLLREQKELEEGEFKEYMSEILEELTEGEKKARIERKTEEAEPEIVDYIRRHIEKGINPKRIEETLLHAGWTQEEIDTAFEHTGHHIPPIHPETREMHGSDIERLESMITRVKHAIEANNVPEAQNTLANAKDLFDSIHIDPHKKELLKFELQELKTEIDLALLR